MNSRWKLQHRGVDRPFGEEKVKTLSHPKRFYRLESKRRVFFRLKTRIPWKPIKRMALSLDMTLVQSDPQDWGSETKRRLQCSKLREYWSEVNKPFHVVHLSKMLLFLISIELFLEENAMNLQTIWLPNFHLRGFARGQGIARPRGSCSYYRRLRPRDRLARDCLVRLRWKT